MPLTLAVVLPTYNEIENIQPLLDRLAAALGPVEWEAIFVDDDSPDGTAAAIRAIAAIHPRVRVLQRIGRRGLASACVEGMMATAAPYIAVMDADLQHDETILPGMLDLMRSGACDLVVASRNVPGGSMGEFPAGRVWISNLGRSLTRWLGRCELADPMSGYFLVDRRFFEEVVHRTSQIGFKILVDIVVSSPRPVRVIEVPYHFRPRFAGESKLDLRIGLEYLYLVCDKLVGRYIPIRFALFVLVGTAGLVLHLTILGVLLLSAHVSFAVAQLAATLCAMTFNFLLNNVLTYGDRRLRGWSVLTGLLTFYAACGIGAAASLAIAQAAFSAGFVWYLAGLSGMVVSSVWNYSVTTILTWRQTTRARWR